MLQEDKSGSYFGCCVGRVANRIQNATFALPTSPCADAHADTPANPATTAGGSENPTTNGNGGNEGMAALEANDGAHALHGGPRHWGRHEWLVVHERHDPARSSVTFQRISPDGEAGYPGEVNASVTYSLTPGDASSAGGGGGSSTARAPGYGAPEGASPDEYPDPNISDEVSIPNAADCDIQARPGQQGPSTAGANAGLRQVGTAGHGAGSGRSVATLTVTFKATATKATPINVVQHSHWNLAGRPAVEKVRARSLCRWQRTCKLAMNMQVGDFIATVRRTRVCVTIYDCWMLLVMLGTSMLGLVLSAYTGVTMMLRLLRSCSHCAQCESTAADSPHCSCRAPHCMPTVHSALSTPVVPAQRAHSAAHCNLE